MSPQVFITGLDCFIWQCLASVLIPGNIIKYVVRFSKVLISGSDDDEEEEENQSKGSGKKTKEEPLVPVYQD
tara:strand:- start:217 stop:432 length:216 start_codon:yes stop_codon:yes gene_type:complete